MSQAVSRWPFGVAEWFRPMSVHVRSVVDEVPRGLTFLRVLLFFHVTVIIPMLHTYVSSTSFYYQAEKRAKPGKLQKSHALSVIGKHRVERR